MRFEPLLALIAALQGLVVMAIADGGVLLWAAMALLGGLGALGLATPGNTRMAIVRSVLVPLAVAAAAASSGGFPSSMTLWLVVTGLLYPAVLAHRWAWLYPVWASLVYLSLAIVPSPVSFAEAMARVAILAIGGYLTWGLGSSTTLLAGERARAESELRAAQGRFQVAFANSSSGMAMIELGGRINQANQALSDFLGTSMDDLEGADWMQYIHPDDQGRVEILTEKLKNADIWSFQEEIRCLHPGGRLVWGLIGAALVTDEEGDPLYLFAHFQDITSRVATEVSLRTNEEHYRNLFGRSPIPIWEADYTEVGEWLEGLRSSGIQDLRAHLNMRHDLVRYGLQLIRLRDVNEAALALVEAKTGEEFRRASPLNVVTEGTVDAFIDQFVAIWRGRDRVQGSVTSRSLRGKSIEGILHWVAPVLDGERGLAKVVLAFADFTESRRAEEALHRIEERLRAVVSAAPIFLFALDRHGTITLSEGQALRSLGLASGEAVGRSSFELFRDSADMITSVRRALNGESFTTAIEVRGAVFDARFAPIWDRGQVSGVIGVANDVTERTRASERLEQLVRSKDQFVASVSHELRTPLTAVVGFAQELRDGLQEFSREELDVLVRLIAEQSMEVADLVEDLLVAARADVDSVAVAAESVEFWEQLELVLLAWPTEHADRVDLVGEPTKVYADPIRLRQILRNLLSNAQRYGGDRIEVRVIDEGDEVRIQVRDDGEGIPRRDRDKVFEPYFRAHETGGKASSVGLGLTVSRQLARLMDGELSYRYEEGWSIFELALPSN